jgi:hypothetical protein
MPPEISNALASESLKTYAAPAIALIVGLLGTLVAWAKDRSGSARRLNIIDEASKRAEFWKNWKVAIEDAESQVGRNYLNSEMEKELMFAASRVVATRVKQEDGILAASKTRRFFLLYKMSNATAKILRFVTYYLWFVYPITWIVQRILYLLLSIWVVLPRRAVIPWKEVAIVSLCSLAVGFFTRWQASRRELISAMASDVFEYVTGKRA